MNRIERYATGTAEVTSSLPPSEFPHPASALPLDRSHSPATSMQTTAATYAATMVDQQLNAPAKASSGRLAVDSGREHGTVSPGGLPRQTTGGSTAAASPQEGGAYRDVHITGSEPRVWPGAISSSLKRQSSAHDLDRAAEQQ